MCNEYTLASCTCLCTFMSYLHSIISCIILLMYHGMYVECTFLNLEIFQYWMLYCLCDVDIMHVLQIMYSVLSNRI